MRPTSVRFRATLLAAASVLAAAPALAQGPASDAPVTWDSGVPEVDKIVTLGSRSAARSTLDSATPVELLRGADLQRSGAVAGELGQSIASLSPSFLFPRQSNSGTSDHVRAGQLRGLAPDQTLVLVNGKRRHVSAIVNTETKIGRGQAAVDLNAIPLGAISRVEILRDGAGAQYGSDAIAGVINLVLDDAPDGAEFALTLGTHHTDVEPIGETLTDGETVVLEAELGRPVGPDGGFVRGGVTLTSREATNRAGFDQIPFFEAQTPANLALQGTRNYAIGDPEVRGVAGWYNSRLPLTANIEAYGFGTFDVRETKGATFFRYPDSDRNITAIYPEGFLPITTGESFDLAGVTGLEIAAGAYDIDLSSTFGRNQFTYGVENSLNASIGPISQTRFESGTFIFDQWTLNADAARDLAVFGAPGRIAFGAEVRSEGFEIEAGEFAASVAGPFDGQPGAQGAPGFTPEDERSEDRTVFGAYVDVSSDLTDRLFVNLAGRAEDYSDFGSALAGKASALYRLTDGVNLRGSVSNSFRAPTLSQVGFSDRTVNFGTNRTLVFTRTVPLDTEIAAALGAPALDAETSLNLTAGATARLGPRTSLTVDAFHIAVDDRITLSERFFGPGIAALVQPLPGGAGVESVRFFTNAVDTETEGVDIALAHSLDLAAGVLDLSAAYAYAETEITGFAPTPAPLLAIDPSFRLVGVEEINTIEDAAPKSKFVLAADYTAERWSALARVSHFGEATRVFNFGGGFEPSATYGAETQLDLEGSWRITEAVEASLGAANVLDAYPDLSPPEINFFGNLPYDVLSPIGVNGRYVYGRVRVRL